MTSGLIDKVRGSVYSFANREKKKTRKDLWAP